MHRDTTKDQFFRILSRTHRRHTLTLLQTHGELTLADLADKIARRTHDAPPTTIPADTVRDIYLTLSHTHIPMLVDTGFVTYDQDQDRVALTDRGNTIEMAAIQALPIPCDESACGPG